jgi:predicted AAA+ superfamily ATPase
MSWPEALHRGFYPRIHDKQLEAAHWLRNYFETYLQRDVRSITQVGDLDAFSTFVRLCAGRSGQLLNLSSLAADCGVTHTTARRWLSVLETGFLVIRLRPHHRNFNKRLVKTPKLYFLDTGLLCQLLGIRTPSDLSRHALRGAVFESFVVGELWKASLHLGELPRLTFWRDVAGHEVDLLAETGDALFPVEIKSGQTYAADFPRGIHYWNRLSGGRTGILVYGGDRRMVRDGIEVYPWFWL